MRFVNIRKCMFFMCGFFKCTYALNLEFDNHTVNLMDILIPTVHSENEICKNHSLIYQEQLSKFTVWATDMFDASTKFPNGMFFGSTYNTGNFDECVKVHKQGSERFSGQHCMAYFKIMPLNPLQDGTVRELNYDENEYLLNMSTWQKLAIYGENRMKKFRDETYITFCIPSTCSYKDLEDSLKQKVDVVKDLFSINVEVNVNRRNCQVERQMQYSRNDLIFVGIIAGFIIFEIFCTSYHLFTESEGMERFKLSGTLHNVIKAFSFSNTMKKITSISSKDDGTFCMHGFKVIATLWVIFGHRIFFILGSAVQNPEFAEGFYGKIEYSAFHNAPIIVDTFFAISGFLACYLILCELEKHKKVNIFAIYVHRIIRLTPAYVVMLGFYCTIFYKLGDGPFWDEKVGVETDRCIESWWTNLLYINNYVNLNKTCMFHSWYLSVDTQFFLIVPILAYVLWRHQKIGLIIGAILITVSMLIQSIIVYVSQEDPFLVTYLNSKILRDPVIDPSFQNVHIPSHMRASSYFVGAIAGFLKFKLVTTGYKISKPVRFLLWTISAISIGAVLLTAYLFYIPPENKNYIVSGVYSSMHRFLWSLGTAWCFIGVSEGYGCLIAPILNWKPWRILSRITYTSYLVHGAFHVYSFGSIRNPIHLGKFTILKSTVSDIFFVYSIGFCLCLVFESPIIELESVVLKRKPHSLEKDDEIQDIDNNRYINKEFIGRYNSTISPKISGEEMKNNESS